MTYIQYLNANPSYTLFPIKRTKRRFGKQMWAGSLAYRCRPRWRRPVALSEHPPMNVAMDTWQYLMACETSMQYTEHIMIETEGTPVILGVELYQRAAKESSRCSYFLSTGNFAPFCCWSWRFEVNFWILLWFNLLWSEVQARNLTEYIWSLGYLRMFY